MSFKDFTILVDLDGTLKTEFGVDPPFEVETLHIESGMNKFDIGARPYITDFLDFAKTKGQLAISTASGRRYARKTLMAMGISHYFEQMFTAESFQRGIPYFPNCIFIDNDEDSGMKKMDKMAKSAYGSPIVRNDLWTIDTYMGTKDDTTMLDLIEELKNIT